MSNDKKKYELIKKKVHKTRNRITDAGRVNEEILTEDNKKAIWKPNLGFNKKLKQTKTSAAMYGEFIASKLAQEAGIKACDVELITRSVKRPYTTMEVEVPGCLSYIHLEDDEVLIPTIAVMEWFRLNHSDECKKILDPTGELKPKLSERDNLNVELVIPAYQAYMREKGNATEKQCQEVKQNIIDMITFDCRFANRDRHDENFGIAIRDRNSEKGPAARFYPLFDNEYILGFPEYVEDFTKYSEAALQEHIDSFMCSRMGINSLNENIGYKTMMTYLFEKFPEETKKSYEKVMRVKETDLIDLMENCDGLDDIHKNYALRLFKEREKGMQEVKEQYIDEKGNFIPSKIVGEYAQKIKPIEENNKNRNAPSFED